MSGQPEHHPNLELGIAIRGDLVVLKFPVDGGEVESVITREGAAVFFETALQIIADSYGKEGA